MVPGSSGGEAFEFEGFLIPEDLAILTGGGEYWAPASRADMAAYAQIARSKPVRAFSRSVVGLADADPLLQALGPEGS